MNFAVLHICDYAAAYKGGFINALEFLRKDVQKDGVEQVYLFPHRALSTNAKEWIEELRRDGAAVYVQTDSFVKNISLVKRIVKTHKVRKIFRHFNDLYMDIIIRFFCPSIPVVRFFHCVYSASGISHKIRKLIYKNDVLVGVSKTVADDAARKFPDSKVEVLENSISLDRLSKIDPFEKTEKITCLTMGYNCKAKGIDLTFEALKRIRKKHDVVLYVVVASHAEELNEEIKKHFGQKPEWLTVLPPTENIGTYFHNADIFLSPSRSEGLPFAVFEAMYCGCLAVASDIPQLVTDKVSTIRYFRSEDVSDYTRVLSETIEAVNSPEAKEEIQTAKKEIEVNYSMQVWCDRVKKLI